MPITLNGSTGITTPSIDASAGNSALTTLSVGGNNISSVNSLGFRNRIINGDMRIDQRNAGASVTPSQASYLVDRWVFNFTQASKFSFQQNAGSVTPPAGFTNYLGATVVSAVSVGAGDVFVLRQRIEGFNVSDLGWGAAGAQTVTLSFWVRSSLTGTFGGALQNNAENRAYPFSYAISAANTWEQKTVTIAGDTTGTWLTNNSTGIILNFSLGCGSTFSGTAGAWAANNFNTVTGATSVVGTNGATFYVTGVQLEAGSVATPFERRDYGREAILCYRYYQQYAGEFQGFCALNNQAFMSKNLPVIMRATPTVTISGTLAVDNWGIGSFTGSGSAVETASVGLVRFSVNTSGRTTGTGVSWQGSSVTISAEL